MRIDLSGRVALVTGSTRGIGYSIATALAAAGASVAVVGRAHEITKPTEKAAALESIVEHMLPGRTGEARAPTDAELKATHVLRVPLNEVSAKVRTGPPVDDVEDLELAVWAGEIPLRTVAGTPIPVDAAAEGMALPRGAVQPSRWAIEPR